MSNLTSLDKFNDELREVEYLLSSEVIESNLPAPEEKVDNKKRNRALCRASLVMLVAHFEGFVKAALCEFVDALERARPPARRVPGAFLELLTRDRVREIASMEDSPHRIYKTRKLFSVYGKLWDEDRSIDANLLSSKVLMRQLTNAGPDALETTLSFLEIENPTDRILELMCYESEGKFDNFNYRMRKIVDMRNQIAHGSPSVSPEAFQVQEDMRFITSAAAAIDRLIQEKINYCCSLH